MRAYPDVVVSNLTVNMLIAFAVIAELGRRMVLMVLPVDPANRHYHPRNVKRRPVARVAVWSTLMLVMVYWLTLWGYETSW